MKTMSYNSPLGKMTILADEQKLYGLWFNDQKYFGGHYDLKKVDHGITKQSKKVVEWLDQYFAGQNPAIDKLAIDLHTTEFRQKVYRTLQKVPYGQTVTYKELSDMLQNGQPTKNLSRAVGNAIGHNEIMLIIPCHRVIGSDGTLTGYAGGLKRKKVLLQMEGGFNDQKSNTNTN